MTGFITKKVIKRILGETLENKFGTDDPFFESVPATRLDGTPTGKMIKRRKALPPGLSDHDAKVLTKVKRRAYRLDMGLGSFCGVCIGYGSLIGVIPFVGDVLDTLLALMVVNTAKQVEGGLPCLIKVKMYMWVLADFIIGLIPFLGDLLDAIVMANKYNAVILEDHLRRKGAENLRKSGLPIPEVDPSNPEVFDRRVHESRREQVLSQPSRHENMSTDNAQNAQHPTEPTAARVHDDRRTGGGFFGFGGSKKSRPADVEMGSANPGPARKSSRRY